MLLILIEMQQHLKKLVKFACNTIDIGTKYCQKQPMFNKVGCCVEDIFSVFLSVLCILCVHLVFFIFI